MPPLNGRLKCEMLGRLRVDVALSTRMVTSGRHSSAEGSSDGYDILFTGTHSELWPVSDRYARRKRCHAE